MLGLARALSRGAAGTATTPAALACCYSIQVVVPPLGESITDGTIATVLKKAGDSVQENETIAQIETDKVTVDIKAPSDGTVLGVVVQEQDTVVPGQLVATLDDAAAKAHLIGAASPRPAEPASAAAAAEAPAAAAAAAPAAAHAARRIPGIRFPPRVTEDGRRVSQLPAAEATAYIQQWRAGSPAAAPGAASAAPTAPEASPAEAKPVSLWPAAAAAAADGPVQPSKFASSAVRLERMPARRELTDKEMELIELGGAA